MKCVIGMCVFNAEKFLNNALKNLNLLLSSGIFDEYLLIFSYDHSKDNTLEMLNAYKEEYYRSADSRSADSKPINVKVNIKILINNRKPSNIITVSIADARNLILNEIYNKYNKYNKYNNLTTKPVYNIFDYFIMMDMNYIHEKTIQPDILKRYLTDENKMKWDCLTFNREPYYDFWALSLKPYYISLWHWEKPNIVKSIMDYNLKDKLNGLNDGELLDCVSAFGGFGIYKIEKFNNCTYFGLFDYNKLQNFGIDIQKNIDVLKKYTTPLSQYHPPDCEHKYFHMEAINKNEAKIRISPENLFN